MRVLLVDDQALVRAGLIRILMHEADIEVVGECSDGDEVVQAVADTSPDVVVMDVRRLMAKGATNHEIGEALFISEATVKSHIGRIFTKLDLRDRSAAIVLAYEHRLVEPGQQT